MDNFCQRFWKMFLEKLAAIIVWRLEPIIIAVSGVTRKSLTGAAIYAVLKDKNYNKNSFRSVRLGLDYLGSLSVPLTIIGDWSTDEWVLLKLEKSSFSIRIRKIFFWLKVLLLAFGNIFLARRSVYPEIIILEYSLRNINDIRRSLAIGKPKIGIITAINDLPSYLEFWNNPEFVRREVNKVVEGLPASGFAIINRDDESLNLKELTRAQSITFGFNDGADMQITNFENKYEDNKPIGVVFKLNYEGSLVPVMLKNVLGKDHAYAAAAAACIGLLFGLNLVEISESLRIHYRAPEGAIRFFEGMKNIGIIDGGFEPSLASFKEALDVLDSFPGKRKLAVLGDILYLGKYAIEIHEEIGRLAASIVDILITLGPRSRLIANSAQNSGLSKYRIYSCDTIDEVQDNLRDLIQEGDILLIKGSEKMGLSRVVEYFRSKHKNAPIV